MIYNASRYSSKTIMQEGSKAIWVILQIEDLQSDKYNNYILILIEKYNFHLQTREGAPYCVAFMDPFITKTIG